jgi:hypothetical protein
VQLFRLLKGTHKCNLSHSTLVKSCFEFVNVGRSCPVPTFLLDFWQQCAEGKSTAASIWVFFFRCWAHSLCQHIEHFNNLFPMWINAMCTFPGSWQSPTWLWHTRISLQSFSSFVRGGALPTYIAALFLSALLLVYRLKGRTSSLLKPRTSSAVSPPAASPPQKALYGRTSPQPPPHLLQPAPKTGPLRPSPMLSRSGQSEHGRWWPVWAPRSRHAAVPRSSLQFGRGAP